jgi:hypothetical protein
MISTIAVRGPGSVVGIAPGYGLDGPGIESRWGRDLPHLSRPALGPTQPPVQWVLGLSRGKERPGREADPSPPSSAVGQERVELYLYSPMGRAACTEPQCLYRGALYYSSTVNICINYNFILGLDYFGRGKYRRQEACPVSFLLFFYKKCTVLCYIIDTLLYVLFL